MEKESRRATKEEEEEEKREPETKNSDPVNRCGFSEAREPHRTRTLPIQRHGLHGDRGESSAETMIALVSIDGNRKRKRLRLESKKKKKKQAFYQTPRDMDSVNVFLFFLVFLGIYNL